MLRDSKVEWVKSNPHVRTPLLAGVDESAGENANGFVGAWIVSPSETGAGAASPEFRHTGRNIVSRTRPTGGEAVFSTPGAYPAAAARHIERIRCGEWDVLADTYFDAESEAATGAPDAALFRALAYAAAATGSLRVCTPADVRAALEAYETERLQSAGWSDSPDPERGPVRLGSDAVSVTAGARAVAAAAVFSPLVYLAHARLAALESHPTLQLLHLFEFQARFPALARAVATGGWLMPAETTTLEAAVAQAVAQVSGWGVVLA